MTSLFNEKDMDGWILFQKVILKVMLDKVRLCAKITYNPVVIGFYDHVIILTQKYTN